MIWIIPFIILILSLTVVVMILVRKMPSLRVISVESIPKERVRLVKEKIILQKMQRIGHDRFHGFFKVLGMVGKFVSRTGRRLVQKLYSIEQSYQKIKRSASEGQHVYDQETINRLVREAEGLMMKDEMIPAEKIFIDIISHNPKSVDAYEGLGNLYLKNDQTEQARETLQFALRISPNDASVLVSLAELEMKLENAKVAVGYLRKAVQKRSKNPKYLDFLIEASLKAGSLKDAQEGIRL
ncbi:MAG: tetratricopeptide repeat protein, partial [Patescibacteria group bacterium]